ncbi:MAG TPA: RNA polymerase sigma factor, partial [Firmicutes bacterium]|nr:RNA polymerase sigma factor [Bacillota bacterium]
MDYPEQQLIQRAKQGETAAMEQIFRMHLDSAVRLAYLVTRNWATAEDAVQEAFVQAFRSLDTFQEHRPFKPWFTRIVINKAKRTK